MTQSTPFAALEPVVAPDPDLIIRHLLAEIHRLRSALNKQLSGNPARRKAPKRCVPGRLFLFPEGCELDMQISSSPAGESPVQPDACASLLLSAQVSALDAPTPEKPAGEKPSKPEKYHQLSFFDQLEG